MSSDKRFLALRLVGPLQSWGYDSQYNRRNTGLMPTKSAIAGMCCAALGYPRGCGREVEFLAAFGMLRMIAIAIPRQVARNEVQVSRLQDFQTVGGGYDPTNPDEIGCITVIAKDGAPRKKKGQSLAVLTRRQYLTDASYGVLIEGDKELLGEIASALANPTWGLWLGRKTCIPAAPIYAGLEKTRDKALRTIIGTKPLESFMRQEDVDDFADGRDTLPDMAVSFATERRVFAPRRVNTLQGK